MRQSLSRKPSLPSPATTRRSLISHQRSSRPAPRISIGWKATIHREAVCSPSSSPILAAMRNLWLLTLVPGLAAGAAPTEPTVLTPEQRKRDEARVPIATAVVDAYPNWDAFFSSMVANFSPDATNVLSGSVRDGLPEIYLGEVDRPAAAPRAITHGPERAIWARFTIDGKAILFLRDEKGNEQHHIWRVNADGTGAKDLTPGGILHRG